MSVEEFLHVNEKDYSLIKTIEYEKKRKSRKNKIRSEKEKKEIVQKKKEKKSCQRNKEKSASF